MGVEMIQLIDIAPGTVTDDRHSQAMSRSDEAPKSFLQQNCYPA